MELSSLTTNPRPGTPSYYKDGLNPHLEITTSYLNYTGEALVVALRNGLVIDVPCTHRFGKKEFVICVSITFSEQIRDSLFSRVNNVGENSSNELKVIKDYIVSERFKRIGGKYQINIEYPIDYSNYITERSMFYATDADIVIAKKKYEDVVWHPCSETSVIRNTFINRKPRVDNMFLMDIEVNDTSGKYPCIYLRHGVEIHTIKTVCDKTKKDGIYFNTTGEQGKTLFIDFSDDMLKYGFYKTYAEASELGDSLLENKQKQELVRLEHELKQQRVQNERMSSELKAENMRLENQLNEERIKHDKEKLERERAHQEELRRIELEEQRRKLDDYSRKQRVSDYYEERSYQRKDSSEWLKAMPTLLVGLGGLFMAMKSFNN